MDVCEPPTHEDSTLPISTDEFESLMAPLFGKEARGLSFGVALSGGADSLALTMLLHQWITQRGGSLQALTVDHGLRQDSDQEALEVALWLKRLGIAHTILTIPPWDPKSRIQEHARAHRHHLLATYCSAYNLRYLFFGHHIQDQWETFLHRLAHKSGLDGLTCMSPLSRTSFGFKCRPLLDVPKQRLVATLKTCKLSHMEDPSNRDPRFHRSKIRDKAQALTDLGLTPEAINGTLHKLRKVRESLDTIVASAFEATTMIFPLGYATVDLLKLQTFPREITRRLFEDLSLRVSPNPYPPRSGSFDSILDCLYPKPSPLAFINSDGGLPEIEEMVEKNHPPRTWSIQGIFCKNSVLWIMRAPRKTPPTAGSSYGRTSSFDGLWMIFGQVSPCLSIPIILGQSHFFWAYQKRSQR